MPKQTLTGAKAGAAPKEKGNSPGADSTAPDVSDLGEAPETDGQESSASDSGDDEGESDPDDAAGDADPGADSSTPEETSEEVTPGAGADRPLADYRQTFGRVDGSVLFADQIPFLDACMTHIAAQGKQIAELQAANTKLEHQNAELAKEVHGEEDPIETGAEGGDAEASGGDPIASFASGLKIPGQES